MSELQTTFPNRRQTLADAYACERTRLAALSGCDTPQGDYLHPVFGAGEIGARVAFVGEAPGREEAESGMPFVGKAGRQLNALLESAGIDRANAYVTNVVKYRPVVRGTRTLRNRTPGREEIAASLTLLRLELMTLRPQTIVTLGNTPLNAILALADQSRRVIGELHGQPCAITIGELLQTVLFPLYHPASGIYNRALVPTMEQDILALGEHLVNAGERTFFDESVVL